jgi:hypothetical protein
MQFNRKMLKALHDISIQKPKSWNKFILTHNIQHYLNIYYDLYLFLIYILRVYSTDRRGINWSGAEIRGFLCNNSKLQKH